MKILKRIILSLIALIVLAVAGTLVYVKVNKQKIIAQINETLKGSINGDINIDNIGFTIFHDFPKANLILEGFYLRGPKYAIYHKDFLKVDKVFISVNPFSLLSKRIQLKRISIENAEANIFKTKDGYSNLDVFKKTAKDTTNLNDTSQSSPLALSLESLRIKNTKIIFLDSLKEKYFGLELVDTDNTIDFVDSSYHIGLKGKVDFMGLVFNVKKGTFLKNKSTQLDLALQFVPTSKTLHILPASEIALNTGKLNLQGQFIFNKPLEYKLEIKTDSLEIDEGLSVLADTAQYKLKRIGAFGYASALVNIEGVAIPNTPPQVSVLFVTKNAGAKLFGRQNFKDLSLQGQYLNGIPGTDKRGKEYSSVKINNLRAVGEGVPIQGNFSLFNMADPDLDVDLKIHGGLTGLNEMLDQSKISIEGGRIEGEVKYKGKLKEYFNESLQKLRGALSGYIHIKQASLHLPEKALHLNQIEANMEFNREMVNIHRIGFALGKGIINIKGQMLGFLPFFTVPDPKSRLNLSIQTQQLDLSQFFHKKAAKKPTQKKKKLGKVLKVLGDLEEKMDINIELNANEVVRENFVAKDLEALLFMRNNSIDLKEVTMKFAGGSYFINGKMNQVHLESKPVEINARMKGVKIKEVMRAFDNFGLAHLTHENISGTLNLNLNVKGRLNREGKFLNDRLYSEVNFSVKDGLLLNFDPIMKVGEKVYRNKDLSKVEFAEIVGHVHLRGDEAELEEMEISSNVIRMFLRGHYKFQQKSELQVQVPLKSLVEKHKGVKPENIGTDAKTGPSVYLKMEAAKGEKMKVTYIPFPKNR